MHAKRQTHRVIEQLRHQSSQTIRDFDKCANPIRVRTAWRGRIHGARSGASLQCIGQIMRELDGDAFERFVRRTAQMRRGQDFRVPVQFRAR